MVRLLCVGDIHLGRVPSRIPESLQQSCSPRAAWLSVVDEALKLEVDAVVLAGDVVDSDNRFFEAYGPLAEGARRLTENGIRLLGVAGNHDVEVLPRLASEVPGFTLLGAGGTWTSEVVRSRSGNASNAVTIRGWSFPKQAVEFDPLDSFPRNGADEGMPWVGVLHTQLDGHGSPYAPVATSRLKETDAEAWLLGHVHMPSLGASNRVGYLGNLTPLDPTETGARGPWLVQVAGKHRITLEQLPLAPLRWDRVDVPVDELERVEDVDSLVARALNRHREAVAPHLGSARALGCRLRFVGTAVNAVELRKRIDNLHVEDFSLNLDGVTVFGDAKTEFAAREAHDLEELAQQSSPPGLLARRILQLKQGGADILPLLASARERLRLIGTRRPFQVLAPIDPSDDEIRQALISQSHRLLEELLAQKSDAGRQGVSR